MVLIVKIYQVWNKLLSIQNSFIFYIEVQKLGNWISEGLLYHKILQSWLTKLENLEFFDLTYRNYSNRPAPLCSNFDSSQFLWKNVADDNNILKQHKCMWEPKHLLLKLHVYHLDTQVGASLLEWVRYPTTVLHIFKVIIRNSNFS